MKKDIVKIIAWAIAGVHYDLQKEGYNRVSVTTYMNPEYFLPLFENGQYQARPENKNAIFAGAYVIDMEKVIEKDFGLSFKCPLLDVNIPGNAIRDWSNKIIENSVVSSANSMDFVGIELYVEYWRNAGARIGKVQEDGKTIIWEM